MKFVFCEKQEWERDVICNVLDSWDVHYRIKTNRKGDFFYRRENYDVQIDVEPAFYEFLNKEIDKVITLEANYHLPALPHPTCAPIEDVEDEPQENNMASGILSKLFGRTRDLEEDTRDSISSNIISAIKNTFEDGVEVDFEELPNDLKDVLLSRVPKEILMSKHCKIIRTLSGITIKYEGGTDC